MYRTGLEWGCIDGVIFDVDGTLYDLGKLRRLIFFCLLKNLMLNPARIRDVRILRKFRNVREQLALEGASKIGTLQFTMTTTGGGFSPQEVEAIVRQWMYDAPLRYLPTCSFQDSDRFIAELRRLGVRVGIFSDCPAEDKISTLGITVDAAADATMSSIGRLKPDPSGFLAVARILGVHPEQCLVVGDRDERDGEAARRGGFQFLLKRSISEPVGKGQFAHYSELLNEIREARACDAA